MLKKLCCIFFVFVMIISVTACSQSKPKSFEAKNSSENVFIYETWDKQEHLDFLKNFNIVHYRIIAINTVKDEDLESYIVTYKKKSAKPAISTGKMYESTSLAGKIFLYTTSDVGEYLDFIDEFDNARYKMLEVNIELVDSKKEYRITYQKY